LPCHAPLFSLLHTGICVGRWVEGRVRGVAVVSLSPSAVSAVNTLTPLGCMYPCRGCTSKCTVG
jgi:hypothetical protein